MKARVPNTAMPEPLLQLLRHSWVMFASRLRTFACAAIVFTLLSAASYAFFTRQAERAIDEILQGTGVSREELAERFDERMQGKDFSAAIADMELLTQAARTQPDPQDKQAVLDHLLGRELLVAAPLSLASMLASLLILFIAWALYLQVTVQGVAGTYDMTYRLFAELPGLLGVSIWAFICSCLWIPVLGFLLSAWLGPRLLFAPVVRLKANTGIHESVKLSFVSTRGYWMTIVSSLAVLGLLLLIAAWLWAGVVGSVALFSSKLGMLLWMFGTQLLLAYATVFVSRMAVGYIPKHKSDATVLV